MLYLLKSLYCDNHFATPEPSKNRVVMRNNSVLIRHAPKFVTRMGVDVPGSQWNIYG
jgi:hypothetical protein